MTHLRTRKQQEILTNLSTNFGIDESRVLFINPRDENDPWIPADELESIARQIGGIKSTSVLHDKVIPELNQIAYLATVVDKSEVTYNRSGVATIGEKPNEIDIDADTLAAGRALGAALRAAGFHPYRSGSVVDFQEMREEIKAKQIVDEHAAITDEAKVRIKVLQAIHAKAAEKNLIVGKDYSKYRVWLFEKFGVYTAAMLDVPTRASVINALDQYNEFLDTIPVEFREDALIA